jgi:uncharacterized protein
MKRIVAITLLVLVLSGALTAGLKLLNMVSGETARSAEMVRDEAGLLNEAQKAFIGRYHQVLLTDFDIDLRVLTEAGEQDIAQSAVKAFERSGVGALSETGRGLLLLIMPDSDKVRLEVSEALEPVFTDTFAAYVQQRQMVPFFQSDRVAEGILATTELLYSRALEAQAGESFDPRKLDAASSGAGAQTAARIGEGYDADPFRQQTGQVSADGAPLATVQAYLDAMANRDARTDLPIYSEATRRMLADWTVTPAQMDNITRVYKACSAPELRRTPGSVHAVLRYPVGERRCAPWFLVLEGDEWRLDLTMMQKAIGFNHRNEWHFVAGITHDYSDTFADLVFDDHGFPHERPRQRWSLSLSTKPIDDRVQTRVTWVGAGSPAEKMGFRVGDRLLQWDEIEVEYAGQVSDRLSSVEEGEVVTAVIERDGQQRTLRMAAPPRVD